MASTLTITGCAVGTTAISITFSAPVDQSATDTGAANPDNFTIYDPAAPGFAVPTNPDTTWSSSFSADGLTVTWTLPVGTSFTPGDFVLITVTNIALASATGTPALDDDPVSLSRRVPGGDPVARTAKNVEDAVSYPVLTEEIGYRPSPVGIPTVGAGGISGTGASIGQVALKAVSDVLGWKASSTDPKGFVGALTQSFTLTEVEGHVESTWTPRTYTVQTDLGGGITGAQASLYMRAKDALDQSLALLDGLYPLDPDADPEYVKALREMARSQMTEIIKELGVVGLPSILRINTYFDILLGQHDPVVEFDPDEVEGTLGTLRDTYGIYFDDNRWNNSIPDEQDITNFRVISDYMTSLLQSWIANRDFFRLGTPDPTFFGTQLVLISRQFNVIIETVNEVRFALDSVFIGPNERQTLLLEFSDSVNFPPMFLEDVLDEIDKFASDEGPRLLRDSGKISVTNNLLPVVDSLAGLVDQAHRPANRAGLPDGYRTARVQKSLDDLEDQLNQLISLIRQVEQQVPPPLEGRVVPTGVNPSSGSQSNGIPPNYDPTKVTLSVYGDNFAPGAAITLTQGSTSLQGANPIFYSAQRVDATFDISSCPLGPYDVTLTNPDGDFASLPAGFQVTNGAAMVKRPASPGGGGGGGGSATPSGANVSALQSQLQKLQKSHDDLKQGHETLLQRLDDIWKKLSGGDGDKDKK